MPARQSQPRVFYSKANTQVGSTCRAASVPQERLRASPPGLTSLLQGQSQEGKGEVFFFFY